MPRITINGKPCDFEKGQTILQVANANGIDIPQYCYHDGLSIVASCRICLAEVWAPNPRNDNKLEPFMGGKLLPTCQTPAADGMVVYSDSPKSVANQKAVMEYLLINHPLDCPVCDQAGECLLQDYSYQYGRSASRFEEMKVKQPKKNLGPNVLLYSDRCIMCSRCVRFTREVTGTNELIVQGRGDQSEIDIFPGKALDNELSANVVDLCPVGALLDKDFLFAQRVWYLKRTPSIDGITASGDNIWVEHNEGRVWRFKPRTNLAVNKWWITDEVRFGWRFIHSEKRLSSPRRTQYGVQVDTNWARAMREAIDGLRNQSERGRRTGLMVSPMLPCEEAFALAEAALAIDENAFLGVGPIPRRGEDKLFPPGDEDGFRVHAEKCPNARGVQRVLEAVSQRSAHSGYVATYEQMLKQVDSGEIGGLIVTGNYPSDWITEEFLRALEGRFVVAIDTLRNALVERADVVLPGATWVEKAGVFVSARGMIQAFEQAVPVHEGAKAEGRIAQELLALVRSGRASRVLPGSGGPIGANSEGGPHSLDFESEVEAMRALEHDSPRLQAALAGAADLRARMASEYPDHLAPLVSNVSLPSDDDPRQTDMEMVEL